MDVRELRYFVAVVDQGSINRAAKAIGISQPALTKSIRVLERRLGVKLLQRDAKGIATTMYGQSLYARAKSIAAELARAEAEIKELSRSSTGVLCIGVLPSQATNVLPEAAVALMRARPGLCLRVVEKLQADLEGALRRGEFDFIISVASDDHGDPRLAHKVLFYDRPTVVVRRGHPLLDLPRPRIEDLAMYPWVLPPPGTERRSHVDRLFDSCGLTVSPNAIECHSASFAKTIVMQSDYVGLLQNDAPTQEERAGLLRSIPLEPKLPDRAIGVLYRADYPMTEAALALIREIQRACQRLGYRKAIVAEPDGEQVLRADPARNASATGAQRRGRRAERAGAPS